VAEVAVETGIPPQFLMHDAHMLKAIVAVLADRAKRQKRGK
jgi:hypothetical protein